MSFKNGFNSSIFLGVPVRAHLYVILTLCTNPFSPSLEKNGIDLFMPRKLLVGKAKRKHTKKPNGWYRLGINFAIRQLFYFLFRCWFTPKGNWNKNFKRRSYNKKTFLRLLLEVSGREEDRLKQWKMFMSALWKLI